MTATKLHLAFLWHQHQPMYKNPETGIYEMPWVRLHAAKDYYDLAAILDEFPKIKFNINLVPSLMLQLDDYASGNAKDKIMEVALKPVTELKAEEKIFILENFFMANASTKIMPFERYRELYTSFVGRRFLSREEVGRIALRLKPQEILDIEVWFHLAWTDPYWRRKDNFIDGLFKKGKNFTEEEKINLIKKHLEICGTVVGKHKELQERGQAEISTTPFYHPILPLLCDTSVAKVAMPWITLPQNRFRHPEDAKTQIQKAIEFYTKKFGALPRGFWPSEGSVSEEVVKIFEECGIKWIATDEEVLARTLAASKIKPPTFLSQPNNGYSQKGYLYRPYRVQLQKSSDFENNNGVNIFFRDHALSDAIGFVYASWDTAQAVEDFMGRLENIKNFYSPDKEGEIPLVNVILDGENCWEYYKNDGEDFLKELLDRLSDDEEIETITYSDYIAKKEKVERPASFILNKLHPGSWINANFAIWIGHIEDNISWDMLYDARRFLEDYVRKNPDRADSPEVREAYEHLYAAEGSDWNWWYGDDHSSAQDALFDQLYRSHLKKIYQTLGAKPPERLNVAIKTKRLKSPILEPSDFLKVKIDGIVTNYYEWLNAGVYQTGHVGGSMHQVENIIKAIYYGFDKENLYIRIDTPILKTNPQALEELSFLIKFITPSDKEILLNLNPDRSTKEFSLIKNHKDHIPINYYIKEGEKHSPACCTLKIIEMAVPFSLLETTEGEKIEFAVVVLKGKNELERWPYQTSFSLTHPDKNIFNKDWSV